MGSQANACLRLASGFLRSKTAGPELKEMNIQFVFKESVLFFKIQNGNYLSPSASCSPTFSSTTTLSSTATVYSSPTTTATLTPLPTSSITGTASATSTASGTARQSGGNGVKTASPPGLLFIFGC
jgi:hypothetical protein